jgi:hypothetical protein
MTEEQESKIGEAIMLLEDIVASIPQKEKQEALKCLKKVYKILKNNQQKLWT